MKSSEEKIAELMELIEIPEIRQIILAKFDQTKLIFKEEIRDFRRAKLKNIVPFPGGIGILNSQDITSDDAIGEDVDTSGIEVTGEGFFDTTRLVDLSEMEQVDVFLKYFYGKQKFRREVLYEFLLKKMPFGDVYEDAG